MNATARLRPCEAVSRQRWVRCSPALAGLAAPYGVTSRPNHNGEAVHFLPGAFDQSLDQVRQGGRAVLALWNHDFADILGGTHTGDLRLWEAAEGLQYCFTSAVHPHRHPLRVSVGVGLRGSDCSRDVVDGVPRLVFRSAYLVEVSFTGSPLFAQTTAIRYPAHLHPGSALRHPALVDPAESIDQEAGELVGGSLERGGGFEPYSLGGRHRTRPFSRASAIQNMRQK